MKNKTTKLGNKFNLPIKTLCKWECEIYIRGCILDKAAGVRVGDYKSYPKWGVDAPKSIWPDRTPPRPFGKVAHLYLRPGYDKFLRFANKESSYWAGDLGRVINVEAHVIAAMNMGWRTAQHRPEGKIARLAKIHKNPAEFWEEQGITVRSIA